MFPLAFVGGMSISLISSNVAQGITNFGFLPLADLISPEVVFGLFAAITSVTGAFVAFWMVETRDLPPKLILAPAVCHAGHSLSQGDLLQTYIENSFNYLLHFV
jgi:hypothetical protein